MWDGKGAHGHHIREMGPPKWVGGLGECQVFFVMTLSFSGCGQSWRVSADFGSFT